MRKREEDVDGHDVGETNRLCDMHMWITDTTEEAEKRGAVIGEANCPTDAPVSSLSTRQALGHELINRIEMAPVDNRLISLSVETM